MLLCLDVGNTHVFGGVIQHGQIIARFRHATHLIGTSDQFGIFLSQLLHSKQLDRRQIEAVSVASVVPSYDYTIKHAIFSYFQIPFFILQAGVKTGLNIKGKNPAEIGADRIANAIGAAHLHPNKNLIVIDLGTATTFCAINKHRDYLGGSIMPGMRVAMEALVENTAKLMSVGIEVPQTFIGRDTKESIQIGLYYGHLGALKEITDGLKHELFRNEDVFVIGTGGFAQLFKDRDIFDVILPDLVLQGLQKAYELNSKN